MNYLIFVVWHLKLLRELILAKNDYCELCDPPLTHTMCKYPPGPNAVCKNYETRTISPKDKDLIVSKMNKIRNEVALGMMENRFGSHPPAANMRQLEWDNELQEIAQRWADQCTRFEELNQKDYCRDTRRFSVGQNIAHYSSNKRVNVNFQLGVDLFFKDRIDFDPQWVEKFENTPNRKSTFQYTQLVWAESKLVGCGFSSYQDKVNNKFLWIIRIVCNFGPSGNVEGKKVYQVGSPCSSCPNGTRCNRNVEGLCTDKPFDERDGISTETESNSMNMSHVSSATLSGKAESETGLTIENVTITNTQFNETKTSSEYAATTSNETAKILPGNLTDSLAELESQEEESNSDIHPQIQKAPMPPQLNKLNESGQLLPENYDGNEDIESDRLEVTSQLLSTDGVQRVVTYHSTTQGETESTSQPSSGASSPASPLEGQTTAVIRQEGPISAVQYLTRPYHKVDKSDKYRHREDWERRRNKARTKSGSRRSKSRHKTKERNEIQETEELTSKKPKRKKKPKPKPPPIDEINPPKPPPFDEFYPDKSPEMAEFYESKPPPFDEIYPTKPRKTKRPRRTTTATTLWWEVVSAPLIRPWSPKPVEETHDARSEPVCLCPISEEDEEGGRPLSSKAKKTHVSMIQRVLFLTALFLKQL